MLKICEKMPNLTKNRLQGKYIIECGPNVDLKMWQQRLSCCHICGVYFNDFGLFISCLAIAG